MERGEYEPPYEAPSHEESRLYIGSLPDTRIQVIRQGEQATIGLDILSTALSPIVSQVGYPMLQQLRAVFSFPEDRQLYGLAHAYFGNQRHILLTKFAANGVPPRVASVLPPGRITSFRPGVESGSYMRFRTSPSNRMVIAEQTGWNPTEVITATTYRLENSEIIPTPLWAASYGDVVGACLRAYPPQDNQ